MIRAAFATIGLFVLIGACLFLGAGRLAWPAAWAVMALFAGFTLAAFVLLPEELLRERAAPSPGSDRRDMRLASVGFLGLYPGTFLVAGLDAGRSGSAVPPAGQVAAFAVFVAGYAFALWAMSANRFFATFVRIQEERGHHVVSRGPYARIRHPGYAGALAAHLALPFALGSPWALLPAGFGVALFVLRTAHEDRVLAEQLPGYRDYQARVPWRLLPGVW